MAERVWKVGSKLEVDKKDYGIWELALIKDIRYDENKGQQLLIELVQTKEQATISSSSKYIRPYSGTFVWFTLLYNTWLMLNRTH